VSDSKVEDIFTHNHQSQLIFEFAIITVGPPLATPYSPIMLPDLQTIGHYTPSYVDALLCRLDEVDHVEPTVNVNDEVRAL